jgi:hypothetical protein
MEIRRRRTALIVYVWYWPTLLHPLPIFEKAPRLRGSPMAYLQSWPEPSIYGVCTVFLAGKSPNIRFWPPCIYVHLFICWSPDVAHTRYKTLNGSSVGDLMLHTHLLQNLQWFICRSPDVAHTRYKALSGSCSLSCFLLT